MAQVETIFAEMMFHSYSHDVLAIHCNSAPIIGEFIQCSPYNVQRFFTHLLEPMKAFLSDWSNQNDQ